MNLRATCDVECWYCQTCKGQRECYHCRKGDVVITKEPATMGDWFVIREGDESATVFRIRADELEEDEPDIIQGDFSQRRRAA